MYLLDPLQDRSNFLLSFLSFLNRLMCLPCPPYHNRDSSLQCLILVPCLRRLNCLKFLNRVPSSSLTCFSRPFIIPLTRKYHLLRAFPHFGTCLRTTRKSCPYYHEVFNSNHSAQFPNHSDPTLLTGSACTAPV